MVGMSTRKPAKKTAVAPRVSREGAAAGVPIEAAFEEVVELIRAARQRVASRRRTFGECGSWSTPTTMHQNSHRW